LKNSVALLLILSFLSLTIYAQKNKLSKGQNLLWTRYHVTAQLSPKVSWVNEADNRVFIEDFKQAQFIAHTHLHYKTSSATEASLGFTYAKTQPANPYATHRLGVPELRPFQEFYIRQTLNSKWRVQQRFRSEQRFFRKNNGIELSEGYTFNWRFRYQFSVNYALSPKWALKAHDELFINAGKNIIYNTFDANRLYLAAAYKAFKPLTVELGFLKSIQQAKDGITYVDRNNIRFTIFHTLNFSKNR
jgi:hypothetical protein